MCNNISCNVHFMNIGVRETSVPSHHPSLNDNLKSHNSSHHKKQVVHRDILVIEVKGCYSLY